MFDIIIHGAPVVDGTGAPARTADVGIRGDRIAALGDLAEAVALRRENAPGLVVSPGFIDAHTHSDILGMHEADNPSLVEASTRQGVTTEVVGNCGFSPFPHAGMEAAVIDYTATLFGERTRAWPRFSAYREEANQRGLPTNRYALVGHGTIRTAVTGADSGTAPHRNRLGTMRRLVMEALEEGAAGLSSGLIYAPGNESPTTELVALASELVPYDLPYVTHLRDEGARVLAALEEAIEIGARAGVPVHIAHHKVAGRLNWGLTERTLQLLDDARARGVDVSIDVYPYTAASTFLYQLLPPWMLRGGIAEMLDRVRKPEHLQRVEDAWASGLPGWQNFMEGAKWDDVFVCSCANDTSIEGKTIQELADSASVSPGFIVMDLLSRHIGNVMIGIHLMSENDVERAITFDGAMVASDAIPLPGKPHPRVAGTFPRFLSRFVKTGKLSLEQAIRKISRDPAERFRMGGRGTLEVGSVADLVLFNPAAVCDNATFEEPLRSPSGIELVIRGGRIVFEQGNVNSVRTGQVLTPA